MTGFFRRKIVGKNYGFIEGEDERDYFVYWNDFDKRSIPFRNVRDAGPDGNSRDQADKVTFDYEDTPKGPHAKNVFVCRTGETASNPETTASLGAVSAQT